MSCLLRRSADTNTIRAPSGDHSGNRAASDGGLIWRRFWPSASMTKTASFAAGSGPPLSLSPDRKNTIWRPVGRPARSALTPTPVGRSSGRTPGRSRGPSWRSPRTDRPGRIGGRPDEDDAPAVAREGDLRVDWQDSGVSVTAARSRCPPAAAGRRPGRSGTACLVRVQQASPVGRPGEEGLAAHAVGKQLVSAVPVRPTIHSRGVGQWSASGRQIAGLVRRCA